MQDGTEEEDERERFATIMKNWFGALNGMVMEMVHLIMLLSPLGIFFLVLGKMLEIGALQLPV